MEIKPQQTTDLQGGKLINVDSIAPATGNLVTPGVGTVYTMTTTSAAIVFGTSSPTVTLAAGGVYRLNARVQVETAAATLTTQNVQLTLQRTNNTPATVGALLTYTLTPMTTTTQGVGLLTLPETVYTATAGDALTIYGKISGATGAGTVTAVATGTQISATKVG